MIGRFILVMVLTNRGVVLPTTNLTLWVPGLPVDHTNKLNKQVKKSPPRLELYWELKTFYGGFIGLVFIVFILLTNRQDVSEHVSTIGVTNR